jgi:hypothetical protein
MLHTGNRGLYFVIAAFVILGLKGIAKAYTLSSGMLETRETETVFSYMDLAAIGIIAWPILMRRRDS